MNKQKSLKDALSHIKNGDTVMVGGFGASYPFMLLEGLLATDVGELTIIANSMGHEAFVTLMEAGKVSSVITTFLKGNPVVLKMYADNPDSVTIIPQGTFAERIRAGGAGIPGFYTPVGVGTFVEEKKEKRTFADKDCLLETALKADVALIHASVADKWGNCLMRGTTKNFGAMMPAAADYTIVEAEEIVPVGGIDPELVTVPHIHVDAIVKVGE
ncbi:MAG TPA: 3-oxoacid CoA-transferase subunit A [Negativicutes bacterium]|nr:3-oxoacid CoA-transferase subunit A [Negativicutes bacterium]